MNVHRCFPGGEAPFAQFERHYDRLFYLVESHKTDVHVALLHSETNPAAVAALIELVAHFEAFCKHQFAAHINANKRLLAGFGARRPLVSLPLRDLTTVLTDTSTSIGAIVAEQFDFGSAKKVNGLFQDLLKITPFSRDESIRFDRLLLERHLFVHHGGIYTSEWISKGWHHQGDGIGRSTDRLSLCTAGYGRRSDFLFEMALKIVRATVRASRQLWPLRSSDHRRANIYSQMMTALWDSLEESLLDANSTVANGII